ncbi:LuxR family transcriptional regulator [Lysinibacter cavernae]|uniref:LuxR family maltose regulon positive regulatory protein n=1 Tax=Lysinibacter cavernae TaxID=1640652 RepID=A0A7X5QZZ6_9MICO|nr:LuxR family transcriptional regulator [Lysinibacter cavernae]NIH52907.1 LuxR family maltose regulon positive regulatory protein [Lysinibacter cavernae]
MAGTHSEMGAVFLPRPRLVRRLQRQAPLTLVSGIVGSGKSTLINEWLAGQHSDDVAATVRLSLNSTLTTRLSIWAAVVESTLQKSPDHEAFGNRALLGMLQRGIEPENLMEQFLDVLATHSTPATLVIEDLQWAPDEIVHDLIRLVTESHRLFVVITTNDDTAINDLAAERGIVTKRIREASLAMSSTEIFELLRLSVAENDETLSDIAAIINDDVAGHALSVELAIEQYRRSQPGVPWVGVDLDHIAMHMHRVASASGPNDYEAANFMGFVGSLSVARQFTVEVARLLFRQEAVADYFDRLNQNHLGEWVANHVLDELEFVWSPHVWTRLQRSSGIRTRSPFIQEQRRRLAEWDVAHGLFDRAVGLYLFDGEWASAEHVVRHHFRDLLEGPPAELVESFLALDSAQLEAYPSLYLANALLRIRSSGLNGAGEDLLRKYLQVQTNHTSTNPGDYLRDIAGLAAVHGLLGQGAEARHWALRGREVVVGSDAATLGALGVNESFASDCLALAQALLQLDEFAAATEMFRYSLEYGRPGGVVVEDAQVALFALSEFFGETNILSADGYATASATLPMRSVTREANQALYYVGRAWAELDAGDPERGLIEASAAVQCVDVPERWGLVVGTRVFALVTAGHSSYAADLFNDYLEKRIASRGDESVNSFMLFVGVTANLSAGRLVDAQRFVAQLTAADPLSAMARALYALVISDHEGALAALDLNLQRPIFTSRVTVAFWLMRATAALRGGSREVALEYLERAVIPAVQNKLRFIFSCISREDFDALRVLAEERGGRPLINHMDELSSASHFMPKALVNSSLTDRETAVLRISQKVSTNAQIAEELFVSVNTVKSQLRSVYKKLGVSDRDDALALAARLGLFD